MMIRELEKGYTERMTWGGYVESAYYSVQHDRWTYGPNKLHLYMAVHIDESGLLRTFWGRSVSYDPGQRHGKLLVMARKNDGIQAMGWWIENLIYRLTENEMSATNYWDQWRDWRPQIATLTIVSLKDSSFGFGKNCWPVPMYIKTLMPSQIDAIQIEESPVGVSVPTVKNDFIVEEVKLMLAERNVHVQNLRLHSENLT
jgi:hypothetical protein